MNLIAAILSLASGFALACYHGPAANVAATSIAINVSLAPLAAAIANRRGRSAAAWAIAGLMLGAWALAAVMILPAVHPAAEQVRSFPHTDDAA